MREIDAFFDELNPDIKVIWGLSDDDSLNEDAKVTILATGLNNELSDDLPDNNTTNKEEEDYQRIIDKLYHPIRDQYQAPKEKEQKVNEPTKPETIEEEKPEATQAETPNITPPLPEKPLTLAGRIRERLKKIAEELDIITYDDNDYR